MSFASARTLFPVVFATTVLAGCGLFGGQTGEGDYAPPTCGDGPSTDVQPGEETALGFSADDVFLWAAKTFELQVSDRSGGDGAPPVARTGQLTISELPGAHFVDSKWSDDAPEGIACRGRLEMNAHFVLDVPGDAPVHAEFDGVLTADSKNVAHLSLDAKPEVFSAPPRMTLEADEHVRGFWILAVVSPVASAGSISGVAVKRVVPPNMGPPKGDAPSAGPYDVEREVSLASWPSDTPCDIGTLPVPIDASLFDVTVRDVLPAAPLEAPLTWKSDGSKTRVTLVGNTSGSVACLTDSCVGACQRDDVYRQDGVVFSVPLTISASTDDQRWKQDVDGTLSIVARKDGGFDIAELSAEQTYDSFDALTAGTGIEPGKVDASPPVHVMLQARLASGGAFIEPNGTVTVLAALPPGACDNENCPGAFEGTIEEGKFGAP